MKVFTLCLVFVPAVVHGVKLKGATTCGYAEPSQEDEGKFPAPQVREVCFDELDKGQEVYMRQGEFWMKSEVKEKDDNKVIMSFVSDFDEVNHLIARHEFIARHHFAWESTHTKAQWQNEKALVTHNDRSPRHLPVEKPTLKRCLHDRVIKLQKKCQLVYRTYSCPGKLAQDLMNFVGLESLRRCRIDYDIISASVQTASGLKYSQTGIPGDRGTCGVLFDFEQLKRVWFGCVGDGLVKNMWDGSDDYSGAPGVGRAEWDRNPQKWTSKAKARRAFEDRADAIANYNDGEAEDYGKTVQNPRIMGNKGPKVMFGTSTGEDDMLQLTKGNTTSGHPRRRLLENKFFGKNDEGFTAEEMVQILGSKTGNEEKKSNELCVTATKNALCAIWVDPSELENVLKAGTKKAGWYAALSLLNMDFLPVFARKAGGELIHVDANYCQSIGLKVEYELYCKSIVSQSRNIFRS